MMKLEQKHPHLIGSNRLSCATGIISTREAMMQVLIELENNDFPKERVAVFPVDSDYKEQNQKVGSAQRNITPIEGAQAGAITGGLLSLAVGLSVLVIPGIGPVLATESILSTLLISGASTIFGSAVGYFHGWFAPDKHASFYASSPPPPEFWMILAGTTDQLRQAEAILRYWGVREWRIHPCHNST
ncbi:hypothetical protein PGN35_008210 [Nodosilinea sp. PGN35]